MEIYFSFTGFINLIGCQLGLLVTAILWVFSGKGYPPYRKLLSGFFGVSAIGMGIAFFGESRSVLPASRLYGASIFFEWLIMPCSYLYLRSVVFKRSPEWRDLWHAAPAFFLLINYLLFIPSPAIETIPVSQYVPPGLACSYSEGWIIPPFYYWIGRNVQFALYWVFQIWLLGCFFQVMEEQVFMRENWKWIQSVSILLALQFFVFFPIWLVLSFGLYAWLPVARLTAALAMLCLTLSLFFQPLILYGMHGLGWIYEKKGMV